MPSGTYIQLASHHVLSTNIHHSSTLWLRPLLLFISALLLQSLVNTSSLAAYVLAEAFADLQAITWVTCHTSSSVPSTCRICVGPTTQTTCILRCTSTSLSQICQPTMVFMVSSQLSGRMELIGSFYATPRSGSTSEMAGMVGF
jgi:hypothetical protein